MLTADMLQQIASHVAAAGLLDDVAQQKLCDTWPQLRFTFCGDDDMPARLPPTLQGGRYNLYLVGGGEHCLSLTQDIDQAIGVVLAEVEES